MKYEITEENGFKLCEGVLQYKFRDGLKYKYERIAMIKTSSLLIKGKYILAELRQPDLSHTELDNIDKILKNARYIKRND